MENVMITGASAGLGAALASCFAARGHALKLVARRGDRLETLRKQLLAKGAPSVDLLPLDLGDRAALDSLVRELDTASVDVLINNAALGQWDLSWETDLDRLRAMIDLNVTAVATLSTAFARNRVDRPAQLMNVASGAGYALFAGSMPYSATKFFVTAFTEGMAHELRSAGKPMRAMLLAPGPISTEFMTNALEGSSMTTPEIGDLEFHTPEQVADFGMQLFDSDAVTGAVQADMSFVLSDGVHPVGALFDPSS